MYSRITNNYISNAVLSNITNNRDIYLKLQEQYSSQKKVNRPSDDPSASVGILKTNTYLKQMDSYINNIKTAYSEASVSDGVLEKLGTNLQRAKDLATQASSQTNGPDQLKAIETEIDQIIQGVVNLANTQYNGKYIYSGVNSATPAYSNAPGEYRYQGETSTNPDDMKMVQIGEGMSICVNESGNAIFGEYYTDPANPPAKIATGALGDLGKLSAALKATPTDYEAIRANIDTLAKDAQSALASRTKLGNVMNSLTLAQNKYEDLTISYKDQKSRLEDVDLLEVSSNLQYQETILQASLNVGQKIIQPSLLNYM